MPTDVPSNVPSAFFSYCRADSEFALKLAEDLKAAGANVWIDQLDIEPGARWDAAVEEALNKSPRMLVILSPVSVSSDNVRDEISRALRQQKRIIPVLYRDCEVPIRLERLQHIDFRTDYARGLQLLLRSLGWDGQAYVAAPADSAPEKPKAEPSALEREATKEKTRKERKAPQRTSGQARMKPRPQPVPPPPIPAPPKFPASRTVVAIVGTVAVAIWLLYSAFSPSRHPTADSQKPDSQSTQPQDAAVPPGLSAEVADEYRKAQAGSSDDMLRVGLAYEQGEGAPQSYEKAADWYRKAADLGNSFGMGELGLLYHEGHGVSQDERQAVSWYRKAADAGNPAGMTLLGLAYRAGQGGLAQDDKQAVDWFRKASGAGYANGMTFLGSMYEEGRGGLPQDDKQAVYWYRKAADGGDELGMAYLGNMYEEGKGGLPRDRNQAISWYRKAAKLGDEEAKKNLQRLGVNP